MDLKETQDQDWGARAAARKKPLPGLVAVFSESKPLFAALPLRGPVLAIGRGMQASAEPPEWLDDPRLSRKHAEVAFDGRRWTVRDLGSRNGTAVDGAEVTGQVELESPRALRCGDTLWLFCADLVPLLLGAVEKRGGLSIGPRLAPALEEIERARLGGDVLHITGETGTGKELAARAFHGGQGPFVPVNCATIPEQLAERLLFGARKGAYSGADADADGHVQAADGGTLFLDEVAELGLAVQAKLLRVLETREVLPLGGAKTRKVSIRLCSATHGDLRARVGEGKFREDLYFRLARPAVALPPLRERPEEICWHLCGLAQAEGLAVHVSLAEAALLRPWPGNLRELLLESREALRRAKQDGRARADARDLAAEAGAARAPAPGAEGAPAAAPPDKQTIEEALRAQGGNVTRSAAALGLHRNQLRRLIERHAIEVKRFSGGADDGGDEGAEP